MQTAVISTSICILRVAHFAAGRIGRAWIAELASQHAALALKSAIPGLNPRQFEAACRG